MDIFNNDMYLTIEMLVKDGKETDARDTPPIQAVKVVNSSHFASALRPLYTVHRTPYNL